MLLRTLIELHVCAAAMLHFECVPQTHSAHEFKLDSKRVVFLKDVGKERHVDISKHDIWFVETVLAFVMKGKKLHWKSAGKCCMEPLLSF